jgi:hypothetical protein
VRGKKPRDYLIPFGSKSTRNPRGDALGKLLTRYRRKVLGPDSDNELNFHSWRRFAIREMSDSLKAGAIGFDHFTIAEVCGHDVKSLSLGLTFGVYAGRASPEAKRAAIESIQIPGFEGAGSSHSAHWPELQTPALVTLALEPARLQIISKILFQVPVLAFQQAHSLFQFFNSAAALPIANSISDCAT